MCWTSQKTCSSTTITYNLKLQFFFTLISSLEKKYNAAVCSPCSPRLTKKIFEQTKEFSWKFVFFTNFFFWGYNNVTLGKQFPASGRWCNPSGYQELHTECRVTHYTACIFSNAATRTQILQHCYLPSFAQHFAARTMKFGMERGILCETLIFRF